MKLGDEEWRGNVAPFVTFFVRAEEDDGFVGQGPGGQESKCGEREGERGKD